MPQELVAVAPRKAELREYPLPSLAETQVRIKSEFASPKHGTESHLFLGDSPLMDRQFDAEYRIFLPRNERLDPYPAALGNMTVGTVIEIGPGVTKFKTGDRVYGHLPIREIHTVDQEGAWIGTRFSLGCGVREARLHKVPDNLTAKQVVLLDPGHFAFAAVQDAQIGLGDRVAVFGMGAIGLLTVQMARIGGARTVFAVDPLSNRRMLAELYTADETLDPASCDVGYEIKKLTGGKGVDVSIDTSASYQALQDAIRSVHYSGLIVTVSFYHGTGNDLRLGEEWHLTRATMRSSMPVWGNPSRKHPSWEDERVEETVLHLMGTGALKTERLIDPIVSLKQSPEAYQDISAHPERCIKIGIDFTNEGLPGLGLPVKGGSHAEL